MHKSETDEKALLEKIVSNQQAHIYLLNTLSLMELCGAQLISRAMPHLPLSSFVLEHVAEEYRHAFYLRKLAQKLAQKDLDYRQTFCPKASRLYLRNINRNILLILKQHRLNGPDLALPYLLATFVIETRALPFYNGYQAIIDQHQVNISLKSIISEEEQHLCEIKEQIELKKLPDSVLEQCLNVEKQAFATWLHQLNLCMDKGKL